MKYLVIVESPNKIKTLENIFKDEKDEFKVIATAGHILDLDKKNMGVNLKTFEPHYIQIQDKSNIINNIKKVYKSYNPDEVLLAGDIDFEGTFINWSVKNILNLENPRTLEFIALTKEDVLNALKKNTFINYHHLDAQQTRRILDRICGFSITGKLFKIYGGNISAGRVQSVVTKLIIDKENEINEWFNNNNDKFYELKGLTKEEIPFKYEKYLDNTDNLDIFLDKPYLISDIKHNNISIKPPKPFNTSTLQQKANILYHLSSNSTMKILQNLFTKGLITYHRTTSIVLSNECLDLCQKYIENNFGEEYYERRIYKDKNNNSENSHEAIRQTTNEFKPSDLTSQELKIYQLIFITTIQSQMKNKICDELIIKFKNNKSDNFIINNKKTLFKGFTIFKINDNDDDNNFIELNNKKVGDVIDVKNIYVKEKYNNPPARYNEASLINKLSPKNLNIGRPSTYASIIEKIKKREYVEIKDIEGKTIDTLDYLIENNEIKEIKSIFILGEEKNKFVPTELGKKIIKFMNENFDNIMNYNFTADLENKMDLIGENKLTKLNTLKDFYKQLKIGLDKTDKFINDKKNLVVGKRNNKDIILKTGRYGEYIEWNEKKYNCKDIDNNITDLNERYNKLIDNFENNELEFKYKRTKIIVKTGRYGKYFEYKGKNYSIKSDEINDDVIKNIIEENESKILKKIGRYEIINGPYGPYFKYGKKFIGIPKNYKIDELTNDDIKKIIEDDKNKPKKKFFKKK